VLVQLHCHYSGHMTVSCDSVTKRAQAIVASPD
jgi:hypothetical protein